MIDNGNSPNMDFASIQQKVAELLETGQEFHADLLEAIRTRSESTGSSKFTSVSPALEKNYEAWYSLSLRLISSVLPERAADFQRLYWDKSARYNIRSYLIYGGTNHPERIASNLQNQIALLSAVEGALPSVLLHLRGTLQANLLDSELDVAARLLRHGLLRPAGVVAGVVLERHLISVCDSHGISVGKDVSISKLNDALKKANVLDLADWRRIQLLGDLRNKCCHPKDDDPTEEDAKDLVEGVAKTIKRVF